MVRLDGEKMSKSLGNLVFVGDLLEKWEAPAIRLAVAAHHYRVEWEWNDALMHQASARLQRGAKPELVMQASRLCVTHSMTTWTHLERSN